MAKKRIIKSRTSKPRVKPAKQKRDIRKTQLWTEEEATAVAELARWWEREESDTIRRAVLRVYAQEKPGHLSPKK